MPSGMPLAFPTSSPSWLSGILSPFPLLWRVTPLSKPGSPRPAAGASFSPPDLPHPSWRSDMVESHLEVGGAVAFWTLAEWSDRDRLRREFLSLGLESYVPEPRPASAALRDALDQILGGPRVLVRPLATKDGFAVVREERGSDRNHYSTSLVARVPDDPIPHPAFEPWDHPQIRDIRDAFRS